MREHVRTCKVCVRGPGNNCFREREPYLGVRVGITKKKRKKKDQHNMGIIS